MNGELTSTKMPHYSRRNSNPYQDLTLHPFQKDSRSNVNDFFAGGHKTYLSDFYELQDANGYLQKRIRDLEVVLRDNGFDVDGNRLSDGSRTHYDGEMVAMMGMDPERPTVLTKYMETKIRELMREIDILESENEVLTTQIGELQSTTKIFQGMRPLDERESELSREVSLTIESMGGPKIAGHKPAISSHQLDGHLFGFDTLDAPRSTPNVVRKEKPNMIHECEDEMMPSQYQLANDGADEEIENKRIEIRTLDVEAVELQPGCILPQRNDAIPYERDENVPYGEETPIGIVLDLRKELILLTNEKVALIRRVSELECAVEETTNAKCLVQDQHRVLSCDFEHQKAMIEYLCEDNKKLSEEVVSSKDTIVVLQDILSETTQAAIDGAERIQYLKEQLGQQSTTLAEYRRHVEPTDFESIQTMVRVQELQSVAFPVEQFERRAQEPDLDICITQIDGNTSLASMTGQGREMLYSTPEFGDADDDSNIDPELRGAHYATASRKIGKEMQQYLKMETDAAIEDFRTVPRQTSHSRISLPRHLESNSDVRDAFATMGANFVHPPRLYSSITLDEDTVDVSGAEKSAEISIVGLVAVVTSTPESVLIADVVEEEIEICDTSDEVVERSSDSASLSLGERKIDDEESDEIRSFDMSKASDVSIDLFTVFNPSESSELGKFLRGLSKREERAESARMVEPSLEVDGHTNPIEWRRNRTKPNRRGRSPRTELRPAHSGDLIGIRTPIVISNSQPRVHRTRSADTDLEEMASSVAAKKPRGYPRNGVYLDFVSQTGSDDLAVIYKSAAITVETKRRKIDTPDYSSSMSKKQGYSCFASKSLSLEGSPPIVSSTHRRMSVANTVDSIIADTEETYGIEIPIAVVDAIKNALCEAVPDDGLLSIVQALHDKGVLADAESCYGQTIPAELVQALRATSLPPGISVHSLAPQGSCHEEEGNNAGAPKDSTLSSLFKSHKSDKTESCPPFHTCNFKNDETIQDSSLNSDNSWGKLSFSPSVIILMEAEIVEAGMQSKCKEDASKTKLSRREKKRDAELKLSNSLAYFGGNADDLKQIFVHAKKALDLYSSFIPDQTQNVPHLQSSPSLSTSREGRAQQGSMQRNLDAQSLPVIRPTHCVSCVKASPQDLEIDLLLSALDDILGFELDGDLDIALRKASRTIDESLDFVAPMRFQPKAHFGKYLPLERLEILVDEAEIFLGDRLPEGTVQLIMAQTDVVASVSAPQTGNDCSSAEQEHAVDIPPTSDVVAGTLNVISIPEGNPDNLGERYKAAFPESPRAQISSYLPKESSPPPPPDFNAMSASVSKRRSLNLDRIAVGAPGFRRNSSPVQYPILLQAKDSLVGVTLGDEDDLGKMYKNAYNEVKRVDNAPPPSNVMKSPPRPDFKSREAKAKTLYIDELKSPPLSNRTPILSTFLELNRSALLERTQSGREIPLLSPVTEPTWATDGAGTTSEGTKAKVMALLQMIPNLDNDTEGAVGESEKNDARSVVEELSIDTFGEIEAIVFESQRELGVEISIELLAALKIASSRDTDLDSMDDSVVSSLMMSLVDVEHDDHSVRQAALHNSQFSSNTTAPFYNERSLTSPYITFAVELKKKLSTKRKRSLNPSLSTKLDIYLVTLINNAETELGRPIPRKIVEGVCKAARRICSKTESTSISWEELELILHDVCEGYDDEMWFETQEAFFTAWEICRNPRFCSNPSQDGHSSGYFSAVSESESSVSFLMDDPDVFDHVEEIFAEVNDVYGDVPNDLVYKLPGRRCEAQDHSDSEYSKDVDHPIRSNVSIQSLEFDYSQSTFTSEFSVPSLSDRRSKELQISNHLQTERHLDNFIGKFESNDDQPQPPEISDHVRAAPLSSSLLNFGSDSDSGNESRNLHGLALLPELRQAIRRANSMHSESGSLSCAQSIVSCLSCSDLSTSWHNNSCDVSLDGTEHISGMGIENNAKGTSKKNVFVDLSLVEVKQDIPYRKVSDQSGPSSLPPVRPSLDRSLSAHSALSNQSGHSVAANKNLGPKILKELRKVEERPLPFELGFVLKHSGAIPFSMNSDEDLGIIVREYESLGGSRLPADLVLAIREASVAIRTPSSSHRSRRSRLIRQSSGSFRSTSRSSGMPSILESDDASSPPSIKKVAQEPPKTNGELTRPDKADPGIPISGFEEKAGLAGSVSNGKDAVIDDECSVELTFVEGSESESKDDTSPRSRLGFSNSVSTQRICNRFLKQPSPSEELRTVVSIVSSDPIQSTSLGELATGSDQSKMPDSTQESPNQASCRSRSDSRTLLGKVGSGACKELRPTPNFLRATSLGVPSTTLPGIESDDLSTIFKMAAMRMSQ
jgi:hypothetical protein